MLPIEICTNGQTWDVSLDGWFQGTFKSMHDAYQAACDLSVEHENSEIVVHGEIPSLKNEGTQKSAPEDGTSRAR